MAALPSHRPRISFFSIATLFITFQVHGPIKLAALDIQYVSQLYVTSSPNEDFCDFYGCRYMRLLCWFWTRCPTTRAQVSAPFRSWRAVSTPWNVCQAPGLAIQPSHVAFRMQQPRCFSQMSKSPGSTDVSGPKDDYFFGNFADSTIPDSDELQWESLLDRGLAYGLKTRAQLCQEADVGHMSELGTRLIDNPKYRRDMELWEVLLIAQALQNGHEGIKAIWRGMKFRGEAVRLDDGNDPRINALWKIFLSAGSEDYQFLWSICKEAKQLRYRRSHLFGEIVAAALEGRRPLDAPQFASFIGERLYTGREDLLAICSAACQSPNPDSLKAFRCVYDLVPKTQIYADVTSTLWDQDRSDDAFTMHSFLISRHDLPSQFEQLIPFINHLAFHGESLDKFLSPISAAGVSFEAQAGRLWSMVRSRVTGIPADSLNVVASRTLGAAPQKLSDQFIARAFATRGFSFDFAVRSLRVLGLIEVGPLAVRQMAISSPDLATLQARFETLRELDIDTGASVFVRVLKNICDARRWEMVQALVDNDLYHEAFEDVHLQRRLLAEYYRKQDWRQFNRTLVVLNEGRFDDLAKSHAADLVLVAMLQSGDWASAVNRATSSKDHGHGLLRPLQFALAPLIPKFVAPASDLWRIKMDRVAFVIGMVQTTMGAGTNVGLGFWRQAFAGLGRRGSLEELESLVYWVPEWYRQGGLSQWSLEAHNPQTAQWKDLFGDKFQKSLMSWCFRPYKGMGAVSAERCLLWTRILKKLRDEYGIEVKEHTIRWEFIKRLRRLFARRIRLKAPNGIMRSRNRVSLADYWALYDRMWDMRPAGTVNYDDRIEICMHTRELSQFKLKRLRAHGKQRLLLRKLGKGLPKQVDAQEDIVVHRDLFNAS